MEYSSIKKKNSFIDTMHWIEYSNRNRKNDIPVQVAVDEILRSSKEERHYFLEPAVDGVINKISEQKVEASIKFSPKIIDTQEVDFIPHKYLYVNLMKIRRWSNDKCLRGGKHAPFISYLQFIKPWPEEIPLYKPDTFNAICLYYSSKSDVDRKKIIRQTEQLCDRGIAFMSQIYEGLEDIKEEVVKEELFVDTRVVLDVEEKKKIYVERHLR